MSEDFEREPTAEPTFDPTRVSASRVNKFAECGIAFRMKYVENVPEQVMGSFALFGSVVHRALEKWTPNRSQNLVELMRQAWLLETEEAQGGKVVRDFLAEYAKINVEVLKAEKAAREDFERRNPGQTSQAPRRTKHFKNSPAAKALNALLAQWMPRLDAQSPWAFSERDPLPQFYDDSLIIGKRYQRRYGHLPASLHTEFSFDVEWRGFMLKGYIDSVELLLSPEGEVVALGIIDYKTYRTEPAEQKDYRQLVMYDVALRHLVESGQLTLPPAAEGLPFYVGIDYVRQADVECDWKVLVRNGEATSGGHSRAFWQMDESDHDRLERELNAYRSSVESGNFLPADKGQKADFCDYGDLCCQVSTQAAGGCAARVEAVL